MMFASRKTVVLGARVRKLELERSRDTCSTSHMLYAKLYDTYCDQILIQTTLIAVNIPMRGDKNSTVEHVKSAMYKKNV